MTPQQWLYHVLHDTEESKALRKFHHSLYAVRQVEKDGSVHLCFGGYSQANLSCWNNSHDSSHPICQTCRSVFGGNILTD